MIVKISQMTLSIILLKIYLRMNTNWLTKIEFHQLRKYILNVNLLKLFVLSKYKIFMLNVFRCILINDILFHLTYYDYKIYVFAR